MSDGVKMCDKHRWAFGMACPGCNVELLEAEKQRDCDMVTAAVDKAKADPVWDAECKRWEQMPAKIEQLKAEAEKQRLAIVNLMGAEEISGGKGGDQCDVMIGCKQCGRIARYRSMSADEVAWLRNQLGLIIAKEWK